MNLKMFLQTKKVRELEVQYLKKVHKFLKSLIHENNSNFGKKIHETRKVQIVLKFFNMIKVHECEKFTNLKKNQEFKIYLI